MKKTFNNEVILSFMTKRLYSNTPPTVLFGLLGEFLFGYAPQTIELPRMREDFGDFILQSMPFDMREAVLNWKHTDDWMDKVNEFDRKFPNGVTLDHKELINYIESRDTKYLQGHGK